MSGKARYGSPTTIKHVMGGETLPEPPPEGIPTKDKCLMVHPGKGYRWVPKSERKTKERWGYGYVRAYNAHDAFTTLRVEDMTPDELRKRAEALDGLADEIADVKEKTAKEKEYERNEARKEKEAEANKQRLSKAKRKVGG